VPRLPLASRTMLSAHSCLALQRARFRLARII